MKTLKFWRNFALILLAIVGITGSILVTQPSNATNNKYEQMIELGFIDEVKTPEELGLDYLHRRPPELTAGLVDSIRREADSARTQMTDNIQVAIPLNTNNPFANGSLPGDNNYDARNVSNYEGEGYVEAGRPQPFTGTDAVGMITAEANNGGSFGILNPREMRVADASGSFLQARSVAVIDLIVRNKNNGRYYLLPNVRVDSFCRDTLNAVHNRTWTRSTINVRNLGPLPTH